MIGLLRVRNEGRWIKRSIESIRPICSTVLVMDDHSEDDTAAIAESCGAVVLPSPFSGLDETRDKNWLLSKVWDYAEPGEWALMIDGDEAFAESDLEILSRIPVGFTAVSMRILYLWDTDSQVRMDGVYGVFRRPSMFCLLHPRIKFKSTRHGGNFHCGNVPVECLPRTAKSNARLLHFGYMDQADRIRKYHWYCERDPDSRSEDGYRHMVIGDVFPKESRFRWAGPLEVRPL